MRCHVDRLMMSPRVPIVNVKYAQKQRHYKIKFSICVLLQLSLKILKLIGKH